jgi:excisionase family DNA binding protein
MSDEWYGIPEFLTVTEVAELFRIGKMTIYRMCQRGEITTTRFGKTYRIYTRILMDTHPVTKNQILAVTGKISK